MNFSKIRCVIFEKSRHVIRKIASFHVFHLSHPLVSSPDTDAQKVHLAQSLSSLRVNFPKYTREMTIGNVSGRDNCLAMHIVRKELSKVLFELIIFFYRSDKKNIPDKRIRSLNFLEKFKVMLFVRNAKLPDRRIFVGRMRRTKSTLLSKNFFRDPLDLLLISRSL